MKSGSGRSRHPVAMPGVVVYDGVAAWSFMKRRMLERESPFRRAASATGTHRSDTLLSSADTFLRARPGPSDRIECWLPLTRKVHFNKKVHRFDVHAY